MESNPLAVRLTANLRYHSTRAREELGWEPKGPTIREEIENGWYRLLVRAE